MNKKIIWLWLQLTFIGLKHPETSYPERFFINMHGREMAEIFVRCHIDSGLIRNNNPIQREGLFASVMPTLSKSHG